MTSCFGCTFYLKYYRRLVVIRFARGVCFFAKLLSTKTTGVGLPVMEFLTFTWNVDCVPFLHKNFSPKKGWLTLTVNWKSFCREFHRINVPFSDIKMHIWRVVFTSFCVYIHFWNFNVPCSLARLKCIRAMTRHSLVSLLCTRTYICITWMWFLTQNSLPTCGSPMSQWHWIDTTKSSTASAQMFCMLNI